MGCRRCPPRAALTLSSRCATARAQLPWADGDRALQRDALRRLALTRTHLLVARAGATVVGGRLLGAAWAMARAAAGALPGRASPAVAAPAAASSAVTARGVHAHAPADVLALDAAVRAAVAESNGSAAPESGVPHARAVATARALVARAVARAHKEAARAVRRRTQASATVGEDAGGDAAEGSGDDEEEEEAAEHDAADIPLVAARVARVRALHLARRALLQQFGAVVASSS